MKKTYNVLVRFKNEEDRQKWRDECYNSKTTYEQWIVSGLK